MNPMQQPPTAAPDYSSQIRMAAMQTLSPQEQQIVAQSVTPIFIQAMAKIFGEQAVALLTPLLNLAPMAANAPTSLDSFNAAAGANGNPQFSPQGDVEYPAETANETGEEPCPQCGGNDPNCPACSLAYPTPINFRK